MADFTGFVEIIKQAALDAVNASKPMSVLFGKVVSEDPLKIEVEQKMTLERPQLILTRNVTDYKVEMTVEEHETEDKDHNHNIISAVCPNGNVTVVLEAAIHRHKSKGLRKFTVHNALKADDIVLLIQVPGGQQFIVIDRLEEIS